MGETPSIAGEISCEEALQRAGEGVRRRIREDRGRVPVKLQPILAYLQTHLFDPALGVRQMALACGVRDHSIGSLFKMHVGKAPRDYITDCRLEVAETLLRDTGLPVWQIGELVGYSQPPVFSSAFRGSRGLPPGAYRKSMTAAGESRRTADAAPWPAGEHLTPSFLRRALAGGLDPAEAGRLKRWLRAIFGRRTGPPA